MDISVEELLLLENLTNIDSNFREAIGKDLDIASYKTVGQMLDQFTPEVMDKLIQCGDQTVDGGLTSGYEWAAMIQSMKNNPNLCSLKIDRESTAMHGGDAGKTKAICFVKPDGKAIVAFRGTLVKTSGRIMCMEELELEPEKARALLRSPCPLSDVYKEFRDRETEHMDTIRDSIETEADKSLQRQEKKQQRESRGFYAVYPTGGGGTGTANRPVDLSAKL